ncbi:hypothetical protein GF412_05250 [Candidatus Micrarchaeota archaeon]|nr:hypothetical protein [Candidatus Micrarchaeota archaeon]MBD3418360.1 hypothetical protein [Candidatus Micrarchaeota archaeon]
MKWIFAFLVLAGMAFAGQIVNVGEDTGGGTAPSEQEDSECYAQYFQCLRDGCAAAGGEFNELTQGCYGGDDAEFSEAVGKCADAQGNCIMGKSPSGSGGAYNGGSAPAEEGGLCGIGFVLLGLGALLFSRVNG